MRDAGFIANFEICGVIHGRESELQFIENQICNDGGIIIDASPDRISGETDSVTWACKPDGGLFPVDLHLVGAFCDDLVALDEICRAVLFKQLLVNGFSEHSIKSVLNQLDWCYDSNGELLAPTIIQEGWESVGEELSRDIKAWEEGRESDFSSFSYLKSQLSFVDPKKRIVQFDQAYILLSPNEYGLLKMVWETEDGLLPVHPPYHGYGYCCFLLRLRKNTDICALKNIIDFAKIRRQKFRRSIRFFKYRFFR